MNDDKFESALRQHVDELPTSIEPNRDLWSGIERGISESHHSFDTTATTSVRHSRVLQWGALAAAFAFVAVFSWQTLSPQSQILTGHQLVTALTAQHDAQRDALLVEFKGQPALTENWQQQLDELDDAATAIKVALENDPDNTALLRMLQHVHQQQIHLIERVHAPKWQSI